jgi:hypothetical protein
MIKYSAERNDEERRKILKFKEISSCNSLRVRIAQSVYGQVKNWTPGVHFPAGEEIFFYSTVSRPALGSTQPPIQWEPRVLSLGVKRQWWSPRPNISSWCGA